MELLPESHVTPRLASKILFCGKAARLLLSANKTENARETPQHQAIFSYLSVGSPSTSSSATTSNSRHVPNAAHECSGNNENTNNNACNNPDNDDDENSDNAYRIYSEQCGFSSEDIQRISRSLLRVLDEPNLSVQIFESLVEDIHNTLSGKLWILLREKYGFSKFLSSMRNTYLMGKGELYQIILDGILDQTKKNIPAGEKMDKILKWDIIKSASRTLHFDDASLSSTLSIRVNSSNVSINDFSSESASTCISGGAKYEKIKKILPVGKKKINRKVLLCTMIEGDPSAELSGLWSTHVLRRAEGVVMADPLLKKQDNGRRSINNTSNGYRENSGSTVSGDVHTSRLAKGALWLPDQKYVAKGFSASLAFECDWRAVKEGVAKSHPALVGSVHRVIDAERNKNNISNNDSNNNSNNNNSSDINKINNNSSYYKGGNLSTIEEQISVLSSAEGSVLDYPQIGKNNAQKVLKKNHTNPKIEGVASHFLLGGLSCVVHNDKLGCQVLCVGDLGLQFQSAVTVGVSFHGMYLRTMEGRKV